MSFGRMRSTVGISILRVDIDEAGKMNILTLLALVRDKSLSAINKADEALAVMDVITNGKRCRQVIFQAFT